MNQQFVWHPGDGIDASALARLRSHFGQPNEPMGEAWFMSEERRLFLELEQDLNTLTAWQLQVPLQEIATGTSSFGPRDEWRDWYHYLLGQLLPRSHDSFVSPLVESFVTGFVAIYPNGIHEPPYPEFQNDALVTLGRCMMEARCWDGNQIVVGTLLHRSNNNPNGVWCWWDASGDLSASLFFCIKYLPAPLIRDWFTSVLSIASPHWRAQILVWLVGSHEVLCGQVAWPSEFHIDANPSIAWDWSHCLRPELATSDECGAAVVPTMLPSASCSHVVATVRSYFTEEVFLEWLESIASVSYLESEIGSIPTRFEKLYVIAR